MTKSEHPSSVARGDSRRVSEWLWATCNGPSTTLVVKPDGSVQSCEGTAKATESDAQADAAAKGRHATLAEALAAGPFPPGECPSCVHGIESGLDVEDAPARDTSGDLAHPTDLVLTLPLQDGIDENLAAQLADSLAAFASLTLDLTAADDLAQAMPQAVLDAHAASSDAPALHVRIRCDQIDALRAACSGRKITNIECLVADGRDDHVDALAAAARTLGAEATARFVFEASNWFHFDSLVRTCITADVTPDLRILGRDGNVPLSDVAADELTLLRDVVANASQRLEAEDLPDAVQATLQQLAHELRYILRARATAELDADDALPHTELELPPPDHVWCQVPADGSGDTWWLKQLFGRATLPSVVRWLLAAAEPHADLLATPEGTWFRTLVQRIANDQHPDELLQVLRDLYGEPEQRKALIANDQAFARNFDLSRFGGPWAESLGLVHDRGRTRPFEVGPACEPSSETADVTVLIPSYRHGIFIEETLRSVLAQRYGNFKVLIVDDRSPDDTVERARSVQDDRIEVRVNPENLGLGSSVLAALEHIDTPYVALLNSDDLFHPDRLGTCRDVLEQNEHVQLVTTGIDLVDQDGGELTPANASLVLDGKKVFDWVHWFDRVTPDDDLPNEELFAALLECNFLVTSSNLVARTDWLRAQKDGLRSLKYCLDWQLFMEAALAGALHHVHEPLIAYRLHATNTVWFREGRRWSYYLEVNRVAAVALQRFLATDRHDDDYKLQQVVDSVARHLATNTEMDGLALFLNCALDALQLDEAAANRPPVQELIESLNLRAERQREASQHFDEAPTSHDRRRQSLRLLLGTLAGEQAQLEYNQRIWAQEYTHSLERRLESMQEYVDELEENKRKLYEDQKERVATAQKLYQQLDEAAESARALERERDRWSRQHDDVAKRLEDRKKDLAESGEKLAELYDRLAKAAEQRKETEAQLESARSAHDKERSQREQLEQSLHETSAQLEQEQAHGQAQRATIEQLEQQTSALEQRKSELLGDVANLNEEIARLLQTREYRTGNFIWNKLPLAYMSRRGKKWYRRLRDAKQRTKMFFKRRRKSNGTAVVAACWQWPIYSHTFVYQEMISLKNTGLDVQLFHWDLGSTDQLHAAFQSLYENRTQIEPVHENHKKDKEHFEKTKPGKLRSFLERISPLCGKSVEELENESIVLQGCTFARMAELANAKYIHSYFFYDQSFMAMLAAWLLDLPRGVSCYADHMMDDYPWKFVPLHIELCDVIVATSARIKSELSGLSGGRFDDKIVVKPNGVDGDRFPARTRAPRKADEPFEVLSVSRIEPKKGLTHLVEAIAELNKRGHKVVAHIIGSKDEHSKGSLEYAAEFEACIKEHNLEDQVILHGMMKQEDMPPIIDKCRAFVAPYVETESGDKDGIPTAMLEALASSLPVITTNSGSIVEVVDDGVEGLVVAQRDSLAFANALEKVLTDNDVEQRMAKAARARFDKDFDIKVTEKRLHERIQGFLKKAKR